MLYQGQPFSRVGEPQEVVEPLNFVLGGMRKLTLTSVTIFANLKNVLFPKLRHSTNDQ